MSPMDPGETSSIFPPTFVFSTSSILANMLANHTEVDSQALVSDETEQANKNSIAEHQEESQNHSLADKDDFNKSIISQSESTSSTATADLPEQQAEPEDICCQTCHVYKNKHDFTVEERDKYPDSMCLTCNDPPTLKYPKIYFPGQRNPDPQYYSRRANKAPRFREEGRWRQWEDSCKEEEVGMSY